MALPFRKMERQRFCLSQKKFLKRRGEGKILRSQAEIFFLSKMWLSFSLILKAVHHCHLQKILSRMCLLVVNFLTPVMENIPFQAFPILLRFHALLCFHYHRFMGCTIVYPAPFLEDHDKLLHENLCQGSRKICEAILTSAGKVAKNWLVLSYFFIIYSALSAILLCLLFCSVNYSALSAILLCQLFCNVSHSSLSAILLCQLFCSVSNSSLSFILLYNLFCSVSYSSL